MDAQTIRSKINLAPLQLRMWLASEEVAVLVKKINEHFNIVGEKRKIIPRLLLRLAIQDLEADYFAGDLSEELTLERDKALGIAGEIKRGILGPVKKELSSVNIDISGLDQFKIPIIKDLKVDAAPKVIQDIGPVPLAVTGQTITGMPTIAGRTIGGMSIAPAPAAPQKSLSDKGWSRTTPMDPMVKFATTQAPPPAPPASMRPPSMNVPKPSATPAEPAPVMLHEDTSFKPMQKSADFHLSTPSANANPSMGSAKSGLPVKPAVLEFGDPHISFTPGAVPQSMSAKPITPSASPTMQKPPQIFQAPPRPPAAMPSMPIASRPAQPPPQPPMQKPVMPPVSPSMPPAVTPSAPTVPSGIVHYTEFKPQMNSMPAVPKPPQAPQSQPGQGAQPQQNKVITKNY